MVDCKSCNDAEAFHLGRKGSRADETKLLGVLRKPDSRVLDGYLPGLDALEIEFNRSQTGKKMTEMLKYCHLDLEDVYITNLFKCVLPDDRFPTKKEYQKCKRKNLDKQIDEFKPKKMIMFGNYVSQTMFPGLAKHANHKDMIGEVLNYEGIPSLVFQHPSKIWPYSPERRQEFYYDLYEFLKETKKHSS
jgi:uracil-DNA glycosylase family 4